MDAREYKQLREQLGLTNVALARKLGVSIRQAQRYEGDEQRIPKTAARLLQMYAWHGLPAKPKGW